MASRQTRNLIAALAAACGLSMAAPAVQAQQGAAPGPVGGVTQYNLGETAPGRSFVIPRLSLQEVYDTNGGYATTSGASQGDEITSLSAGFTLQAAARRSVFSLDYTAGGQIYAQQTEPNAVLHRANALERITLRRWNILIGENFSYLPNTAFDLAGQGFFGGSTGLPGFGGGTPFNPGVLPNQTIGAPNTNQLSSTTVFQAQYTVNPTSSINFSGTAGFLHYFGSELLDTRNITARFGYDKSFTPRDTLSISYLASIIDYTSGIPGFTSHYVQVGYRRLVMLRLHLSLSVGPVISQFSPQPGQTTVQGGSTSVSWSTNASLDYALRHGGVNAQYNHGVSGGSGFLPGSSSDQLTGGFQHQISRIWSVGFTGGYARNSSLEQTETPGMMNTTSIFNTWYGSASISRPLGRYSSVRLLYNASKQTGNTTTCNGVPCGAIALTQSGGMSINWATRPLALE